uniref:Uncharacterized protein n=1 Tax=Ascaris lumbricoides TaxID=6252 RepID=A0A0M3IM93_ASCLU
MSPHMRRSVPTLAQGRHLSSSGSSGPPSRASFGESPQQTTQWVSRNSRCFSEKGLALYVKCFRALVHRIFVPVK